MNANTQTHVCTCDDGVLVELRQLWGKTKSGGCGRDLVARVGSGLEFAAASPGPSNPPPSFGHSFMMRSLFGAPRLAAARPI